MFFKTFLLAVVLFNFRAQGAGVKVRFEPANPGIGPFPTDYLTAPSTTTQTLRRVNMPQPEDCDARPNDCEEVWLVNMLDGFAPQGRVRVRFSGAIAPDTIKDGIFLVARENLTDTEAGVHAPGDRIALNRIVYDPATFTAYGKPDKAMDQHRRYALIVTVAVQDEAGDPVEPDDAFLACKGESPPDDYCKELAAVLPEIETENPIVGASLYTTMSVTSWLEKARDRLDEISTAVTPAPTRPFWAWNEIVAAIWHRQTGLDPEAFDDFVLPVFLVSNIGGIGFGSYTSPDYLGASRVIEPLDSGAEMPPATEVHQVYFHALLPAREKPESGYPVVIFAHGLGDSRFGGPSFAATAFGQDGFATIAISAPGHGYGPLSTLRLRDATGTFVDMAAPGRGVDLNGDSRIESNEGCAADLSQPFGMRDCLRQTVVDLLQLVRVIRAGLDIDGDGIPDFDPKRIYFAGHSFGSLAGVMFLALEPDVSRAVLNSGGGSVVDIVRWSDGFRPLLATALGLRVPSLLNKEADFDESYVLRDQPVRVVETEGAVAIQNALEMLEWIQAEGDPASYAIHLKRSPLPGVEKKDVLWQFAQGDRTVPNPSESRLIRFAGMQDSAWLYRHDLAREASPFLPLNPHLYLFAVDEEYFLNFFAEPIARATRTQMSGYFVVDGEPRDPNTLVGGSYGVDIFEQPESLPEQLNYLEPKP